MPRLSRPSSRDVRPATLLGALLAGVVLSADVVAEDVPYTIQGKVVQVSGSLDAIASLTAQGVTLDADVSVNYVLDGSTPGVPTTAGSFEGTSYEQAIQSLNVTIGTYEAFAVTTGLWNDITNRVLVGDDILQGSTLFDRYEFGASGNDVGEILAVPGQPIIMLFGFVTTHGTAIDDEDLLHHPSEFGYGEGELTGLGGGGTLRFEFAFSGEPDPDPDPEPTDPSLSALARKGQLAAAAGFAKSVLSAKKKGVSAPPTQDPLGIQEAEAIAKAEDVFEKKFDKAVDKALSKGGSAPLPAAAGPLATSTLLDAFVHLAEQVSAGLDENVKADRALRGKILGAAAKAARKDLLAHAQDAKKPVPETLAKKLAQAEAAFTAAFDKAVAAAAKKDVLYAGPSSAEFVELKDLAVNAFVLMTLGIGVP